MILMQSKIENVQQAFNQNRLCVLMSVSINKFYCLIGFILKHIFQSLFGEEITQYSCLAATRADTFLEEMDLKAFVSDSTEVTTLNEFIQKISRRVVAVNNKSDTVLEKTFMRRLLIDMISIVRHQTGYKSYTNVLFEEARKKQREANDKRREKLVDEKRKEAAETQLSITKLESYFAQRLDAHFAGTNFQRITSMKEDHFKDVIIAMKNQLNLERSLDLKKASENVPNIGGLIEKMAYKAYSKRELEEKKCIQREKRMEADRKMTEFERGMMFKEEKNRRITKDKEEMERKQEEIEQKIQQVKEENARANQEREDRHMADVEKLRKEAEERDRLFEKMAEEELRLEEVERDRVRNAVDVRVRSKARDFLIGHSKLDLSWMKAKDIKDIRLSIIEDLPVEERSVFSDIDIDEKIKNELKILKKSMDYTVPQRILKPFRAVAEGLVEAADQAEKIVELGLTAVGKGLQTSGKLAILFS